MGGTIKRNVTVAAGVTALLCASAALAFVWARPTSPQSLSPGGEAAASPNPQTSLAAHTGYGGPGAQERGPRGSVRRSAKMLLYDRWQIFTTKDGLPSDKANCVRADGERVWVGTDGGLACYEGSRWRAYRTRDGLPHPVVLGLDMSPVTGDLWIATLGGLARFSGGRFDCFNQMNSGLPNDVVYGVTCLGDDVWTATAAGAGRFNTRTREWALFNTNNTLMFEPWTYGVSANDGMVYLGVWGGGVVEYNTKTQTWKDYRDPDGEMEIDLFKDDGLVHEVIPTVSYENGVLWAGSYFGLSRYDGRHWRTYFQADSGLASDFINFVKARGNVAWICTDSGLNSFDSTTWVTYRRAGAGGERLVTRGRKVVEKRRLPRTLAHNYVLGVDLQGDDVWVATAKGVSRGKPVK